MNRLTRWCARLSRCFGDDAGLLIRAMTWRLLLPLLKRLVPLRVLVRFAAADHRRTGRTAMPSVVRLMDEGGRLVLSKNCLERSLVLYRFLSEAGAGPSLIMGVSPTDCRVAGHTWVELDGEPVRDASARQFTPIIVFGPTGEARPSTG